MLVNVLDLTTIFHLAINKYSFGPCSLIVSPRTPFAVHSDESSARSLTTNLRLCQKSAGKRQMLKSGW